MISSTTKYYFRPIIVDEGQLRYLTKMVKERFEDVSFGIETIDNTRYDYSGIDDLLAYNNPNSRKITKINIIGREYKGGSSSVPELYLSIADRSKFDLSCYMQLRCLDESDITYFRSRIEDYVKDSSVEYWWMYKPSFYWSLGFGLYLLFSFILPWYIDWEYHVNVANSIVSKMCWSISCVVVIFLLIRKGLAWLLPAGGFRLGEQIKVFNQKEKVRKWILGLITTVIAGLIVDYFLK